MPENADPMSALREAEIEAIRNAVVAVRNANGWYEADVVTTAHVESRSVAVAFHAAGLRAPSLEGARHPEAGEREFVEAIEPAVRWYMENVADPETVAKWLASRGARNRARDG